MTQIRTIVLSFGIAAAAVYGMPEKFGRDPASLKNAQKSISLNQASRPKAKPKSVQALARGPQAIQVPVQQMREEAAPVKAQPQAVAPTVDGFKESLHQKIASDARWTRYFQGTFIKQLADCTVDAGRRSLDDRQIENQISEAGTDAHRALMFCAVRVKSSMVAEAKKNSVSKPAAQVNSNGGDEMNGDLNAPLSPNVDTLPAQATLGVEVTESLNAPLEMISPIERN